MYQHKTLDKQLLADTNYGSEGVYFVTVNCANNSTPFSTINKHDYELTRAGNIAEKIFLDMEQHFLNLSIEAYTIMPNHIHAIIRISDLEVDTIVVQGVSRFEMSFGMMIGRANPFLVKGSIFHAITWFKSSSMIELFKNNHTDFTWNKGYFDQTIDNDISYKNIKTYIKNDIKNWEDDIDHPSNNFRSIIY